ncbi:MAG: hypothetical protein E7662_06575 [Ruminococcaceae bacterium]|nr:hypothetical protein [Oscillospiraceae bacterium]
MQNNRPTAASADVKKKKIRILIGIGVMAVLGILSYILLQHPDLFLPEKESGPSSMYSDKLLSYSFYPTDYDLDVSADEYYMGLDRYIHIQRGAENFAVTDGDYAAWGKPIEFFARYFGAAIAGDAEAYNALFTDAYYKSHEPYERFAPQMIYGIKLEEMSATESAAGDSYVYNVTYAIYRNDGSFRNDIDSNAFKTLIFYLVPDGNSLKIDAIDYYRKAK